MKNPKQLLLIAFIFVFYSCRQEECDTFSGKVLTAPMETYFGAYKPGNSWIYHNSDSTKRDSVYLSAFVDSAIKNTVTCIIFEKRKFTLHSIFLANTSDINVIYESAETGSSLNMAAPNTTFPSFVITSSDSLIRSLPAADNPGDNRLNNVTLNDTTYFTILSGKAAGNTYYFGKDRGLVGWITASDTFNLVRFLP